MSYVVFDNHTGELFKKRTGYFDTYATERAAKAAVTRLVNKGEVADISWATLEHYLEMLDLKQFPGQFVERTNYMTGEKYMEDVSTPYACSPSSESYWSS